jgi:nitrogen-specific signal transduction histidine kinase
VKRFATLTFGAVLVASAILAVLGYVSLRHWETSAELLFREQARDMATMAAEKIEMTVLKNEEECVAGLQRLVLEPDFRPETIAAWQTKTRLIDRVYLVDRQGRLVYPREWKEEDAGLLTGLLTELSQGFWDREGRRHFVVGDRVLLAAVLQGGARGPLLAVLGRNEEALKDDVLVKTLGGVEGQSVLAIVDRADQPVYASRPIGTAQRVLTVSFGEALPAWRVALYQPGGPSAKGAVRRQAMIFMAAFALLLVVIVLGLAATYRLVERESEMARLKSDFVANVSHDLKTPLSLIRMFAETLELNRVVDESTRQEYYRVITRESERLTRLLDNVLDFSRIEGGRRRYDIRPGAVEPLVQDVLEAFRYPLAQQGFKLDVDIEPELPAVPLDADAIKQALANLVDNAIKYSADVRHVTISARRAPGEVHIAVADEGLGIPTAETERIFEKFYRVGRSDTQGQRGTGVGLALVKHIVEAHGGRVTVESRLGAGSRFTVHLPCAAAPV